MSAEETNNIPEGQVEASPETAAPAEAPAAPQIDTAQIINEAKQAALNEVQNIPGFKQYQDYENFKNKSAEPINPFDSELNLANVTDATKHLHGQLTADQQKYQQQNEQLQHLMNKEAQRDYEVGMTQLTNYWEDKYSDEESFGNAINEAVPFLPAQLQQQWVNANNGTGSLDAQFLGNLDQAMKNLWISKLDDPTSGALDALLSQQAQQKALQDQSMLSSNTQTNDSGKQTDNYSAEVTYYDS